MPTLKTDAQRSEKFIDKIEQSFFATATQRWYTPLDSAEPLRMQNQTMSKI